ncbi:MAG TPA: ImmA/IrrE family metallo-endopeptidase [Pyrinomonadaceae bacterium]|jgi:hypothetical protein
MINEETKQKINKTVRAAFARAGFDYDSWQPEIVPLFEIIGNYSLFVTELGGEEKLTARRAIAAVGQKSASSPVDNDKLSGFLYAAQFEDVLDGWIFTEKSEPTARRRFSAAHEFGHYLYHFLPRSEAHPGENLIFTESVSFETNEADEKRKESIIYVNDKQIGGATKFEMEEEADQFAADLLMPANACLNAAEIYGRKFGAKAVVARRMATEFLVSFEAMRRRLTDLGFYRATEI